jgi:hypothetical protein
MWWRAVSDPLDGPADIPEDAPRDHLSFLQPGWGPDLGGRGDRGRRPFTTDIGPYTQGVITIADAPQLHPQIIIKLAQQELIYSLCGLLVGAAAFVGGLAMVVFTHSSGSVDLLIQYGPTQIHIVTVVIGVVIALFGVIIIRMTRPNIRLGGTNHGGIRLRRARTDRMRPKTDQETPLTAAQ